jgi:hypothetical protein
LFLVIRNWPAMAFFAPSKTPLIGWHPGAPAKPDCFVLYMPNVVFDIGHPGHLIAYVRVSRCYHTGKPKHIFDPARLRRLHGGLPGGPWLPGGGRAFNLTPRTRHAAKSSYFQTAPKSATITAVKAIFAAAA